jgi:hypothetical protein
VKAAALQFESNSCAMWQQQQLLQILFWANFCAENHIRILGISKVFTTLQS